MDEYADASARFGLVQWFHLNERDFVLRTIDHLRDLGVRRLRTDISWVNYTTTRWVNEPSGIEWYDWMMQTLQDAGLDLLVMLCYTPPELARGGHVEDPPRRLLDFADFCDEVAARYGKEGTAFQIWNEPNSYWFWHPTAPRHPDYRLFAEMVLPAAMRIKSRGAKAVLAGAIEIRMFEKEKRRFPRWLEWLRWPTEKKKRRGWFPDEEFFREMRESEVLSYVDAVGIHAFPGMWVSGNPTKPEHPEWSWGMPESMWPGWETRVALYGDLIAGRELMVTESGFATWDWEKGKPGLYDEQAKWLLRALECPVPIYWYHLCDDHPEKAVVGPQEPDPRMYQFGLIDNEFKPKPAYHALKEALRNKKAA